MSVCIKVQHKMALQHLNTVPYPSSLTYSLPKHCIPQMAVNGTHKRFCQFQCLAITKASARRSANYQPTIWSYDFVKSLKNYQADEEVNKEKAKKLEEEVRNMIDEEDAMPLTVLQLIDDIQRLGLAYRFDYNIKKALHRIRSNGTITEKKSLHATALSFRLQRQHGYEVSQDVFKSFMNYNGDFMACLCKDVKGLLSLYEASYLAFKGENILDDAKAFTSLHLKNLNENTDTSFKEQVNHALELSLHHRVPRLEARWFIDSYSKREDANHLLLELAQLDFNMVQSKHQNELKDMSRWWKSIGLANELRFVRDRLMECFFWSVGMVFEPQFSNCRKGLTKVTALITTIDDVYDVYGSLDELELFTDAVERWDINAVETLPEYMKLCFLALYNTVNEMAYDTLKEHGVNIIPHLTKAWADLCKAFLIEAQWCYTKYTPTFESYFDNGWRSVSGVVILIHAYFLMGQKITKEAMDCLENYHDLLQWPSVIFRLCNDLGTSRAELERGETANSILCYMVERGRCEEDARQHMSNLINETWKKMNKYQVAANSPFAEPFTEAAINLARIAQCTYQYGDGHGAPDVRSKNRVLSLIIEPVATHTQDGKSVFY